MSIFALQFVLLYPKSVAKVTKCDFSLIEAAVLDPNFHNFDSLSLLQKGKFILLCVGKHNKVLTWTIQKRFEFKLITKSSKKFP